MRTAVHLIKTQIWNPIGGFNPFEKILVKTGSSPHVVIQKQKTSHHLESESFNPATTKTFHCNDWSIVILIMAFYNPHIITGLVLYPLYPLICPIYPDISLIYPVVTLAYTSISSPTLSNQPGLSNHRSNGSNLSPRSPTPISTAGGDPITTY